ncbi:hypothetical protein RSAG8_05155, partial [Rhizoctonia solani AG-8 WAC10335]
MVSNNYTGIEDRVLVLGFRDLFFYKGTNVRSPKSSTTQRATFPSRLQKKCNRFYTY